MRGKSTLTRAVLGLLSITAAFSAQPPSTPTPKVVVLQSWQPSSTNAADIFELNAERPAYETWGPPGFGVREFFSELLPALFERTLVFDAVSPEADLRWIFTGPRGGFTVLISSNQVRLTQRFYDSAGYQELKAGPPSRHPEWSQILAVIVFEGPLRGVTVTLDHKLCLGLALNGREVWRDAYLGDVSRHQLQLAGTQGQVRGRLLPPAPSNVRLHVDPRARHQTMIGFGGIAAPTAYAQLSDAGKRRWWQLLVENNLLVQREYPIGQRLNESMINWDRLSEATPHYYGDNFPNGEISDFAYLRQLRRLGGQVWSEFWQLPGWVGTNAGRYAEAIVAYCQSSKAKAGAPPAIVGIQNEIRQIPEMWRDMTLTLRRKLDAAGFKAVRIHLSDDSTLSGGLQRAAVFQRWPEVWGVIDFTATHQYDFQQYFLRPDDFDPLLEQWKQLTTDKPFLATELCVNDDRYQVPSYRLALTMGQLYHKNLVLADAAALCYCWTLVNVEQPSFGWTRALFVPDLQNAGVPTPSSHQARVFSAFSRRIAAGMTRVQATSDNHDVLACAFERPEKETTVVMLNRSVHPVNCRVEWVGARWTQIETVSPHQPNEVAAAPAPDASGLVTLSVAPGTVVTLTSVPLGRLPPDWEASR